MTALTTISTQAFSYNQNLTTFELATANILYLKNTTLLGKTDETDSDSYQAKIVSGIIVFGCVLGFVLFAVVMSNLCCNRSAYREHQQRPSTTEEQQTTEKNFKGVSVKTPLTNQEKFSSVVVSI